MTSETYRIFCKMQGSNGAYCVAIRNGKLALALPNMGDQSQQWHKEGIDNCHFMLVDKHTHKVVKFYGNGDQLIMVNRPAKLGKSLSWTEGTEDCGGYTFLRAPALNMVMDALGASIHDGAVISVYPKNNPTTDNQLWKFVPV
ncbi:hypothetical protein RND81_14G231100 [Saponaria officinalis]|uniref:Uncharacterized protein n=1 Tax=Saponaria officinalis TaxID=3572 RepID=A0AAW1GSQ4_SAPOF